MKTPVQIILLHILMFLLFFNSAAETKKVFSGLTSLSHAPFSDTTAHINKTRLTWLLAGETTAFSGSMVALYYMWYHDYPSTSFHFFNDADEWLMMDKAGHVYTSFYFGMISTEGFRWTGMRGNKPVWYGCGLGLLYITSIEVFDGFSENWGASVPDFTSNTLGLCFYAGQEILWQEQRMTLKYSFHQTKYPRYRPGLLGKNFTESMIKDYNGQTYWLSCNIHALSRAEWFPRWLNLAFGYSADGMLGGDNNPAEENGVPLPVFERVPQFYLSLDVDLTRIKTRSRALKILFRVLNCVKVPFPALEITRKGTKMYGIYF